mgnify:CR=1 FL=1
MGSPFIKPLSNQTAVLGKPYTINCTYGGYPLEEVYFVKGRIDNNNDGSGGGSSSDSCTGSLSSLKNGCPAKWQGKCAIRPTSTFWSGYAMWKKW